VSGSRLDLQMRIWIDLANSPHVPFFRTLAQSFKQQNHEVVLTVRDFAETVRLSQHLGLTGEIIGGHGGGSFSGKAGNLVQRAMQLARWAKGKGIDLAVSHNSYSQILAARALGLRVVTLMDYEHQPANHLAFRMASRIIVPRSFPEFALNRFGASSEKVRRYDGIKEDVYLAGFRPAPEFPKELKALGVDLENIIVVIRPPATEALYHRFENDLFEQLLDRLRATPEVSVVLLPRTQSQSEQYRDDPRLIVPSAPIDGANLIAHSDLVISAGGTMNREAAALGVPTASIFLGEWAAIDEQLIREGRLKRITKSEDIAALELRKKTLGTPRLYSEVSRQVANLILEQ